MKVVGKQKTHPGSGPTFDLTLEPKLSSFPRDVLTYFSMIK